MNREGGGREREGEKLVKEKSGVGEELTDPVSLARSSCLSFIMSEMDVLSMKSFTLSP